MLYGLYLSANGMVTQKMRANTIANNMANTNTHGFKKDYLALRQRDVEILRHGGVPNRQTQKHLLAIGGAVEGDRTHSIFKQQGALQPTNNKRDLALSGQGFFKLQDPTGKTYYSRTGTFDLDAENFLVSQNGFRVLSDDNALIQLETSDFEFDEDRRLFSNGEEVATLGIVNVDNLRGLHKIGENMYEIIDNETNEIPSTAAVVPGHLETSTVSAVREMTSLIEAQRAYEANARFIKIQDESLGKAVTQIAV